VIELDDEEAQGYIDRGAVEETTEELSPTPEAAPEPAPEVAAEEVAEVAEEQSTGTGNYESRTVDELQALAESRGLPTSGSKAELIERLRER
jgi:hypothetical protein